MSFDAKGTNTTMCRRESRASAVGRTDPLYIILSPSLSTTVAWPPGYTSKPQSSCIRIYAMVAAICLVGLMVRLLVLKPSSTSSSSL
jgi:hypothetical protein